MAFYEIMRIDRTKPFTIDLLQAVNATISQEKVTLEQYPIHIQSGIMLLSKTLLKELEMKTWSKLLKKNWRVQNSKKKPTIIPLKYPEKGKFQQKWKIFQQRCRKHLSLELHWLSKWLKQ